MSKKTKVLIMPSDLAGVGHHRSIWPAKYLKKNNKEDFIVKIDSRPDLNNINYLTSFDIIHFHRQMGPYENSNELFQKIKEKGTLLIMDIDDYWNPPPTHPLYELVKKEKINEKVENNLRLVDWVTTTTDIFADKIRKFNKNVFVIPNSVDYNSKMWRENEPQEKPKNPERTRVAWIGGSSHMFDLQLLSESMELFSKDEELRKKAQIVMCGFDVRGEVTEMAPDGSRRKRPIQPHETIWLNFEKIFTNNYELLKDNPEYIKWLHRIQKEGFESQYEQNYVRRWTQNLNSYAEHYNYCDICLAPLTGIYYQQVQQGNKMKMLERPHTFNHVKSELKVVEAGMKKKALIAQDFGIYAKTIEHGKTGLLVKNNKRGWYEAIKELVENPGYREELANNLHEWVKEEYSNDRINALRTSFYKKIMNEKSV